MGCCGTPRTPSLSRHPRTPSLSRRSSARREEIILQVPNASVHLMQEEAAGAAAPVELARGDLAVVRITEDGVALAAAVRIGADLRWPLTKDEPVVKLDPLHYLFTLPCRDGGGGFLNYGVSFAAPPHGSLPALDAFLRENACFSVAASPSPYSSMKRSSSGAAHELDWKDYSPRMEDYNGVLAKAIAEGTGGLVKGIFMCSNAYTSQVQKGAALLQPRAPPATGNGGGAVSISSSRPVKKPGEVNKAIKRARKVSEMTERMSRALLDGVVLVTSSVAAPLVRSKAGKSFLAMVPGEVLLASLDALNRVLDAVEIAERNTLAATSDAVSGAVSKRYGESAGEATQDAFATAGHAIGTAWNLFKIRKAISPSSSVQSSLLKNAVRNK